MDTSKQKRRTVRLRECPCQDGGLIADPNDSILRRVKILGYDSVNCSHIAARDSFTTLAGLAHLAPSVTLATAVAPIYHRSPASMAQTAATIDDLSGGRFRLGLGTGHRATMTGWHGQDIGHPVAEMREYVALVRALLAGGVLGGLGLL